MYIFCNYEKLPPPHLTFINYCLMLFKEMSFPKNG